MTDIERAIEKQKIIIKDIEDYADEESRELYPDETGWVSDCKFIIEVLKEKQERDKECEQCAEYSPENYYGGETPNFCENCGRDLRGEK